MKVEKEPMPAGAAGNVPGPAGPIRPPRHAGGAAPIGVAIAGRAAPLTGADGRANSPQGVRLLAAEAYAT